MRPNGSLKYVPGLAAPTGRGDAAPLGSVVCTRGRNENIRCYILRCGNIRMWF